MGSVRQTATIISMTKEHLRTGDKAIVRFRYIKNPEYLKSDMRMVFREGRTKAIGTIVKLYPHISAVAQNTRQQRAAKKAQEANHQTTRTQTEPPKQSKKNRNRMRASNRTPVLEGSNVSMDTQRPSSAGSGGSIGGGGGSSTLGNQAVQA